MQLIRKDGELMNRHMIVWMGRGRCAYSVSNKVYIGNKDGKAQTRIDMVAECSWV